MHHSDDKLGALIRARVPKDLRDPKVLRDTKVSAHRVTINDI